MNEEKIELLGKLAAKLIDHSNDELNLIKEKAERLNHWFSQEFISYSLESISEKFLAKEPIEKWLANYNLTSYDTSQTVGLILAGNIPLVGFHDIFSCFILGLPTKIKISSKDETLTKYIIKEFKMIDPNWMVEIVDRLKDYDKVVATGSNNTNRYFEYYFREVPSILRNNRSSLAILNGSETEEELRALADDIFMFFGHGCRNISKLFVPKDYKITSLFLHFEKYKHFHNHKLYMDNYDYTRTILLMNQTKHYANEYLMVKEEEMLQSRLATINFSYYNHESEVEDFIKKNQEDIQCVVSKENKLWKSENFGVAQKPNLWDYADNKDVIQFLTN